MEAENRENSREPISMDVVDRHKNPVGKIDLDPGVFDAPVKKNLLHEVVLYQQAKHRAGTASSKTRGEVSGSNRKPYRQKGTGRARAGERGSPLWHGGGVIFGPKPRSYNLKVSKKVKKAALKSALSLKRSEGKLVVVDELKLSEIKTRGLLDWLDDLGVGQNALVVIAEKDQNAEMSARNLKKVKVLRSEGINVRDVLLYEKLVMTRDAAAKVQEAL